MPNSARCGPNGPQVPEELRKLRLLDHLSDAELELVFEGLEPYVATSRSTAVFDRDFAQRVGFVWSGSFQVTAVAPNGASIAMTKVETGDAFGLTLAILEHAPGGALRLVTLEAGLILLLPAKTFVQLVRENQALCRALMYDFAAASTSHASRAFELAALSVPDRLLAELVRLAERGHQENGVCVITDAPTHAALAAQIATSREAVTRHLTALAKQGLLKFDRRRIEITDLAALRERDRAASGRRLFTPRKPK